MANQKYPPVDVDLNMISGFEMRTLREETGLSLEDIDDISKAEEPEKVIAVLAWIITRRDFPEVTMDEAWHIHVNLDADTPVDPTSADS